VKTSPTDHIKPTKLIGDRNGRDNTLNDDELRAFWHAAEALPYPEGPAYKLLALTGLRLNEVVRASWPEFDLAKREWTIPASRMKAKPSKAREHQIVLAFQNRDILFLGGYITGVNALSIIGGLALMGFGGAYLVMRSG
jgi:integrase